MKRAAPMERTAFKPVKLKMRKCEYCKKPFAKKASSFQTWCSPDCGYGVACARLAKAETKRQAAERKADREKRKAKETLPQLRERAQLAFRLFIRARDVGKPCICCGRMSSGAGRDRGGEWDGGHYRSRGACPELAFDERNCHAQLKQCNRRSWDVATYRANLIERIGLVEVIELEGPHPPKHYTHDDFRLMARTYRAKARKLGKA